MTGRMYNDTAAKFAALLIFVGFNLTFGPQFILGYLGMPRRYQSYPPEFQIWHVLSSAGASILAVGYALPLFYLLWSILKGARAPANPWNATGLEWSIPSPPPAEKFAVTPTVIRPPYQYDQGKPCMQAEHV
jgi:cytochrome c oxidase subunit 1